MIVRLPEYREAVKLFESYEANVDDTCRILHVPSVRSLMRTFYLRMHGNLSFIPSQAALLLSIFALGSLYCWPSQLLEDSIRGRDKRFFSKIWTEGALDILDHCRRHATCTLEDVQAHVLMSIASFHIDGVSERKRLLMATAIAIAIDLRLHQTDACHESDSERINNVGELVELEVKRRVFWFLASADWYGGPCSCLWPR